MVAVIALLVVACSSDTQPDRKHTRKLVTQYHCEYNPVLSIRFLISSGKGKQKVKGPWIQYFTRPPYLIVGFCLICVTRLPSKTFPFVPSRWASCACAGNVFVPHTHTRDHCHGHRIAFITTRSLEGLWALDFGPAWGLYRLTHSAWCTPHIASDNHFIPITEDRIFFVETIYLSICSPIKKLAFKEKGLT